MATEHVPIFDRLVENFGLRMKERARIIDEMSRAMREAVGAGKSPREIADAMEAAPLMASIADDAPEM